MKTETQENPSVSDRLEPLVRCPDCNTEAIEAHDGGFYCDTCEEHFVIHGYSDSFHKHRAIHDLKWAIDEVRAGQDERALILLGNSLAHLQAISPNRGIDGNFPPMT